MRPVQRSDADFVKESLRAYVEGELIPAMRRVYPQADISTEVIGEIVGLIPMQVSEARDLMLALTGANDTETVPFGTEAGLFQEMGMSVVVCGPGSIAQAHKPDEFVAVSQLAACLDMLEGLGRSCA
jgi:acetylornithine deacetylase